MGTILRAINPDRLPSKAIQPPSPIFLRGLSTQGAC